MRARVDHDRCQGHALCAMEAPEVFQIRDVDGLAVVKLDEIPAEHQAAARRAAIGCPEQAIVIED